MIHLVFLLLLSSVYTQDSCHDSDDILQVDSMGDVYYTNIKGIITVHANNDVLVSLYDSITKFKIVTATWPYQIDRIIPGILTADGLALSMHKKHIIVETSLSDGTDIFNITACSVLFRYKYVEPEKNPIVDDALLKMSGLGNLLYQRSDHSVTLSNGNVPLNLVLGRTDSIIKNKCIELIMRGELVGYVKIDDAAAVLSVLPNSKILHYLEGHNTNVVITLNECHPDLQPPGYVSTSVRNAPINKIYNIIYHGLFYIFAQ